MLIRKTLSDQIYSQLRKDIIFKKIPLGTKLVNRQLQEEFGVSSSPIRDAINRLQQDGIIVEVNNTGATVISLDYDSYNEINEILKYTILTGMDICHLKNNYKDVAKSLIDLNEEYEKKGDSANYYEYDYDFHKVFIDMSGNSLLKKQFKQYNALHELLVREYHEKSEVNQYVKGFEMHKKITEAVSKDDINKAMKLTKDHYELPKNFFELLEKK